jgi:hypothetical protein
MTTALRLEIEQLTPEVEKPKAREIAAVHHPLLPSTWRSTYVTLQPDGSVSLYESTQGGCFIRHYSRAEARALATAILENT